MTARPSLGELLLGVEGLALLRLAFTDEAEGRRARVREIRDLLERGALLAAVTPAHASVEVSVTPVLNEVVS